MPNPEAVKRRMQAQSDRDAARLKNQSGESRKVDALELIADTLISLRDEVQDLRIAIAAGAGARK